MPVHLSTSQQQFVASIVTYGQSIGASIAEMQAVRDIAYNESSFNPNVPPSPTGAIGPFQYEPNTWNQLYPGMNINSSTDQIKAAFEEIQNAANMYYPLANSNPSVYDNYSLSDYADAIHLFSLGTNTQPTNSQLQIAHQKMTKALSDLNALNVYPRATLLQLNEAGKGAGIAFYGLNSGGGNSGGFASYINPAVVVTVEDSQYEDEYGNNYTLQGSNYDQQQQ